MEIACLLEESPHSQLDTLRALYGKVLFANLLYQLFGGIYYYILELPIGIELLRKIFNVVVVDVQDVVKEKSDVSLVQHSVEDLEHLGTILVDLRGLELGQIHFRGRLLG